jgi:hypothetical protein
LAKPKERTLNRPEEAPSPERFQLGIVSEISSEWWAISFRNRGRFKIGMVGDFARNQQTLLSSVNNTAKAINYLLNRWAAFTRFLDDGRVCLSNNAAERALRGVAVGRRNWTFAGSDAGGRRAAAVYTLIEICKMTTSIRKPGSLTCWKASRSPRQYNRRPVAVDLEGGPTVQSRRCCLSAAVNPCACPGWSPDTYLAYC